MLPLRRFKGGRMVQGMGNTNEQRGVTGSMKHGSKHVTYAHVIRLLNISSLASCPLS